MRASRFSDAPEGVHPKQGDDGMPVAEVCRKAGISQATYFAWRKKYAGLLPTEMTPAEAVRGRERPAEEAGGRLVLDKEMLQDVVRRKLVASLTPWLGLPGSASWWTSCAGSGACRSAGRVAPWRWIARPATTGPAAPGRPRSNRGSRRSARLAVEAPSVRARGDSCAMARVVSTSCCVARAGRSTTRGRGTSTTSWACS